MNNFNVSLRTSRSDEAVANGGAREGHSALRSSTWRERRSAASKAERSATLSIAPKRVARALLAISLSLTVLSIAGQVAKHFGGARVAHSLIQAFDLDHEDNVPSWYQAGLLLLGGLLTAAAAGHARSQDSGSGQDVRCPMGMPPRGVLQRRGQHAWRWTGLSLIFTWLSLDEAAGIHEVVSRHLHEVGHFDGMFLFAWVLPALVLVPIVGFCYLRFLIELPHMTRRRLLLAGMLYVGGALGMEMLGGLFATTYGIGHPGYAGLTTIEETLEMLGLVTFIYAVLCHLASEAVMVGIEQRSRSSRSFATPR